MKLRTYALLTIMCTYAYSNVSAPQQPVESMSDTALVNTFSEVHYMVARESQTDTLPIGECIQQVVNTETQKRGIAPVTVAFSTELVENIPEERDLQNVNILLSKGQVHFDLAAVSQDIKEAVESCRSA